MSTLDCLLKEIDNIPVVEGLFDSVNSLFEAATRQRADMNKKQGELTRLSQRWAYALQKTRKYLQRNTVIMWIVDAQQ